MVYGDFKDLLRGTASDKVLFKKEFTIAKTLKYEGYQCGLASVASIFWWKVCCYRQGNRSWFWCSFW